MFGKWITLVFSTFILSLYGVGALIVSAVATFAVFNAMKLGHLEEFVWAASTLVGVATMIAVRQPEADVAG